MPNVIQSSSSEVRVVVVLGGGGDTGVHVHRGGGGCIDIHFTFRKENIKSEEMHYIQDVNKGQY